MSIICPKCKTNNPDTVKSCKDIGVTKTMETPIQELAAGSTLAGRYQIIEELGR